MIRAAKPVDGEGWIIWADSAPDVVANPELESFFWGKTVGGVKNPDPLAQEIYFYDGTAWELLPFQIADGSISLTKLDLTGSTPLYIIQVNALGTALQWVSIINAIQANTLPVTKLLGINDASNYALVCAAGVRSWTLIDNVMALISDGLIPINKLAFGAANTWLRMNPTANGLIWTTPDVADLLAAGYNAGQGIKRNPGNTGWMPFTPSDFAITTLTNGGTYWPVPVSNSRQQVPHGLGVIPKFCRVVLRCNTGVDGYVAGEEIDITGVTADQDGTNQHVGFTIGYDSTYINVAAASAAANFWYAAKVGGITQFVSANWDIKAYVSA